jgi:hypothetical protein
MKNPLLAIIALVALAGILLAQGPPSSVSAHSVVRQVELVGPIQVEGIVPLRDHISIEWTVSPGSPFYWVCPAGTHARGTASSGGCPAHLIRASGVQAAIGTANANSSEWRTFVLHPGDTLRLDNFGSGPSQTGILQLAVEYD